MDPFNYLSRFLGFNSQPIQGNKGTQPRIDERFGFLPGESDIQTMEIRYPRNPFGSPTDPLQVLRTQPSLAGSYTDILNKVNAVKDITPEQRNKLFDALLQETSDDRYIDRMTQMTRENRMQDIQDLPNAIKAIGDIQYEQQLKARPLKFQELVAKNLLKTVTDLPGQVIRAGRMYDQEALAALSGLGQRPAFQETIRYFG